MRTLLTALLAATALLPVQAWAQDDGPERQPSRRAEMREIQARIAADRAERAPAPAREQFQPPAREEARAPQPPRPDRPDRDRPDRDRPDRGGPARPDFAAGERIPGQARPDRGDTRYFRAAEEATRRDRDERRDRAGWDRGDRRDGQRDWRSDGRNDRPDRNDWRDRRDDRGGWSVQVGGNRRDDGPRYDARRYDQRGYDQRGWDARSGWNRDWRGDRRYDWNDWRVRNRQAYRLPRYYAPGGWSGGYRRFGVGIRLSSLLFAQDYWIGDPGYYRLPPVYGPYRWVRYYNDALLVDVRYGTVVDTVYDIFW